MGKQIHRYWLALLFLIPTLCILFFCFDVFKSIKTLLGIFQNLSHKSFYEDLFSYHPDHYLSFPPPPSLPFLTLLVSSFVLIAKS